MCKYHDNYDDDSHDENFGRVIFDGVLNFGVAALEGRARISLAALTSAAAILLLLLLLFSAAARRNEETVLFQVRIIPPVGYVCDAATLQLIKGRSRRRGESIQRNGKKIRILFNS